MTPDQKAAYVNAQAALLNAEIATMTSENLATIEMNKQAQPCLHMPLPFNLGHFREVIAKYEGALHPNALIDFFAE